MKPGRRWLAVLLCLLVGAGGVALTRPTPPYAGRVLYLRLHLAPFFGSSKEIQYWIDANSGRVRYAEVVPNSPSIRAFVNNRPVMPTAPQWMYISMSRRSDGTCGVSTTNWLSGDERGIHIRCAAVLSLRNSGVVRARALALWQAERAHARATAVQDIVQVQTPGGVEVIPLMAEDGSIWPGNGSLLPGMLTLNTRSGQPISMSGYSRGGPAMTVRVLAVKELPPGTLPGDFFDAPRFSLAERAPAIYQWLHTTLPWHP